MSDAAATADLPPPSRFGRLLQLVHKLIDYGTQLTASFRDHPPNYARGLERLYGTSDVAVILARIAQGLLRARFLIEKITPIAARIEAEQSKPKPTPSPRTPRAVQPRAPRRPPEPQPTDTASLLARLPTPDQIAAKVKRQSIGAVIADICRDLGIHPNHPLWNELERAVGEFGGNASRFYFDWLERTFPLRHILAGYKAQIAAEASTGPPLS
jgi:hypothetical protein